jgi:hypothetical protein
MAIDMHHGSPGNALNAFDNSIAGTIESDRYLGPFQSCITPVHVHFPPIKVSAVSMTAAVWDNFHL